MRIQRLWKLYAPSVLKKYKTVLIILPFLIFILIYSHWTKFVNRSSWTLNHCPSETNFKLREQFYDKFGISILPSSPSRDVNKTGKPISQECVPVRTPDGTNSLITCIHDPMKDLMLSAHLKDKGSWESENVMEMYKAKSLYPDVMLVDLGCNIGVFTLPAAKLGMEVVAVDAMSSSLRLLQRSLLFNDLTCPVTLIHNAVYKTRKKMSLIIDPTNIGGSQLHELNHKSDFVESEIVEAICLDDLVPFISSREIFLKMDLEGTEVDALQCADSFFSKANIQIILIEWMFYRQHSKSSEKVKDFLTSHGFLPTWGVDPDRVIDLGASHSWPDNVFWMKLNHPMF